MMRSAHSKLAARTIVVGDLHGCYDELLDLLTEIHFGSNDRVIAVGDLVVKGPKSREVLDLFVSDPRFSSVIGNQDLTLLRFWRGEKRKLTGSQKRVAKELEANRGQYSSYLASLPNMIDLGSHVVVHAGVRPGIPLHEQSPADLIELRTLGKKRTSRKGIPWYDVYDDDKIVLFGHWPALKPRVAPRAIGLDTGCVYGNRLTAFIVETGELHSVPAIMAYSKGNLTFRAESKKARLAASPNRNHNRSAPKRQRITLEIPD
jgi:hypothetical protein